MIDDYLSYMKNVEDQLNKIILLCDDFSGVKMALYEIAYNNEPYYMLPFLNYLFEDIIEKGHSYNNTLKAWNDYKISCDICMMNN